MLKFDPKSDEMASWQPKCGETTQVSPRPRSLAAINAQGLWIVTALFLLSVACNGVQQATPGRLVIALESPPVTFDPRGPTNAETAHIQQLIFDTLVQRNERFEIVPGLAERWEVDEDERTYTFHLRQGVKFHNGKELTSRDVAYTFQSLVDPHFDSPKRAAFARLERADPVDRRTVIFRCRERYHGLLADLLAVGIIPEGAGASMEEHPIGTGPFQFENYVESQEINLKAFADAYRGEPKIPHLRFKIIRDPTTLSLELLSGSVHLAFNTRLSPDFVHEQRQLHSLKVDIADGANLEYLVLNTEDPILADRRVRQAIAFGLNRKSVIESLLQHQAREAVTIFPLHHWAYNENVRTYETNPTRARQLLDAAGYPDPDGDGPAPRLHLLLKTSSVDRSRQIATVLQEQLRPIGIALELQSFESQTYFNDLNRGKFQMGFLRLVGGHFFPDIFKGAFGSRSIPYDSTVQSTDRTGFLNRARYRNPEVDQLVARAEATRDRQIQIRIYHRLQEILTEDLPWIYLWYPSNVAVMNPSVGNVHIPASGDFFFLRELTLGESGRQ